MQKTAFFNRMKKVNKDKIVDILFPIVIFLIAFFWKFSHVGSRDISLDEPFTIFHAQDSMINIVKLPGQNEPNPPLFMLLLHFWIKLFGISAHSVRSLPILFNALTAVYLFLIGKRFFNFWTGITASTLFIFSTYHFFFGADTRTYSMISCVTASSLFYLYALRKQPELKTNIIGFIISDLVLIYGHYFGWFVIFSQFLFISFNFTHKKFLKKAIIAIVITFLAYIPMFAILWKQFFISKEGTWVTPPQTSEYIQQIRWFMNSDKGLNVLMIILAIGIVISLIKKPEKELHKDALLLLLWWIVPYSLMFFISYKIPMFTNRYILFNSIGFYLFAAFTVNLLFQKIRFAGPAASLILIVFMYLKMFTGDFAPRHIKESANNIRLKMDNKTSIVIFPYWADLGFVYYYDRSIFKNIQNYDQILEENNILRTWGGDDIKYLLERKIPERLILYQNNTAAVDPENFVYNYIDSLYIKVDSMTFEGGLVATIFNGKKN